MFLMKLSLEPVVCRRSLAIPFDVGPTLYKYYTNVLCLLGCYRPFNTSPVNSLFLDKEEGQDNLLILSSYLLPHQDLLYVPDRSLTACLQRETTGHSPPSRLASTIFESSLQNNEV